MNIMGISPHIQMDAFLQKGEIVMISLSSRMQAVFDKLQDDRSRQVFLARKNFAESGDIRDFSRVIERPPEADGIIDKLSTGRYILYGAGAFCQMLTYHLEAVGVIDNCCGIWDSNPAMTGKTISGIGVTLPDATIEFEYAVVAVSQRINVESFVGAIEFLNNVGIANERIIKPHYAFFSNIVSSYFDDDIIKTRLQNNEIFIDGGGLDFSTSQEFIKICKVRNAIIKAIHVFEPGEATAGICRRNSMKYPFATIHQVGLWSESKAIPFCISATPSSSHIADTGTSVDVVALDTYLPENEKITFIKFDIEGAELEALKGTAEIIKRDHPKLAICVYHKPWDFLELPEYINGLVSDYEMYLRSYGGGGAATVLYCVK